jgi:hypothetical protein
MGWLQKNIMTQLKMDETPGTEFEKMIIKSSMSAKDYYW